MAVWQSKFTLIEKTTILAKFGSIPINVLSLKVKKKEYLTSKEYKSIAELLILNPNHEALISQLDNLMKRAKWITSFYYWKNEEQYKDHDISLILEDNTATVKTLFFRFDRRDKTLFFLNNILSLAKKYNCLLMDDMGNIVLPEIKKIKDYVNF